MATRLSAATAEQCVIGGLLMDSSALGDLGLTAEDFTDEGCKGLFEIIQTLAREGTAIDVLSVNDRAQSQGLGTLAPRAAGLVAGTPSAANVMHYAKTVSRASLARKANARVRSFQRLLQTVDLGAEDGVSAMLGKLAQDVMEMQSQVQSNQTHAKGIAEVMSETFNGLAALAHQRESGEGLMGSGFHELDELTGGWHPGDLTIFGARPAMGKTALACHLLTAADCPAGFIQTEQPAEQIALRLLAAHGKHPLRMLRSPEKIPNREWKRLAATADTLDKRPIWLYDEAQPTISTVCQIARHWRYSKGIRLLLVDYIQRIAPDAEDSRRQQHEIVRIIAERLKTLSRELEIPIIGFSQVRRDVEGREDKRPHMADLSDSSALEKETDAVIMLYRDEVYNDATESRGIAELAIEKNRHGPIGTVKVKWEGMYTKFSD